MNRPSVQTETGTKRDRTCGERYRRSCPVGTHPNNRRHDGGGSPWTPLMRSGALVGHGGSRRCSTRQMASPYTHTSAVRAGAPTPSLREELGSRLAEVVFSRIVVCQHMAGCRSWRCAVADTSYRIDKSKGVPFLLEVCRPPLYPAGWQWVGVSFGSGGHPGRLGALRDPWNVPPLSPTGKLAGGRLPNKTTGPPSTLQSTDVP